MKDDLKAIVERIIRFRDERDWKQFHKPKDVAISLMLEAGELTEHFQWKSDEEIASYIEGHRDDVAEELCDVLYWVLLLGHDLKIDIPVAFEKKMLKNEEKYPADKARGKHTKYDKL